MDALVDTLRPFHRPADLLGGESVNRTELQAALKVLDARLQRLFWIRVVMIALIFLIEFGFVIAFREEASVLAAVAGAIGITIAGTVKAMAAVNRDMAETGLMVALAGQLDADAITNVVNALVVRPRTDGNAQKAGRQAARASK
jgi:hypothetical protein